MVYKKYIMKCHLYECNKCDCNINGKHYHPNDSFILSEHTFYAFICENWAPPWYRCAGCDKRFIKSFSKKMIDHFSRLGLALNLKVYCAERLDEMECIYYDKDNNRFSCMECTEKNHPDIYYDENNNDSD